MSAQVVLTHTFKAPRELVFKAFTESGHLQNWWGPKGWKFHVAKADFRSGGEFLYSQQPDEGDIMWIKFSYSEVLAPEKIVYINVFSDEHGNIVRAPFDPNWPLKTKNTLTFIEEEGKTILTIVTAPESPTEEELRTFEAFQGVIREGFTGTFDQLAEYVTTIAPAE
ncbi:MAG: polyketide cyclase [Paenibacillus sp.]|jgi:uncharacterized protein YndB with AHSA1/START domain|nr:polyketide cyclase [Paenibacillus sp.]